MFLLFEGVAVTLWRTKSNLFYLFNFSYIGSCLSVGLALFTAGKRYARQFVQLAVGLYMLVYLGLMSQENMQIEGFWYYLFSGVFEAATIHYAVAKIFGPLLFGRGWCGYACWTAMVLDLLPFKVPQKSRKEKLGTLRYVMFALSFALVSALFLMKFSNLERIMFWLFLIGNILYYAGGIALAFIFKDNRAFCKYLCPQGVLEGAIPLSLASTSIRSALGSLFAWKSCVLAAVIILSILFYRPFCKWICPLGAFYAWFNRISLLQLQVDQSKCISCGKCGRVCKMDVAVPASQPVPHKQFTINTDVKNRKRRKQNEKKNFTFRSLSYFRPRLYCLRQGKAKRGGTDSAGK